MKKLFISLCILALYSSSFAGITEKLKAVVARQTVAGAAEWYDDWGRKVVITVKGTITGGEASSPIEDFPVVITEDTVDSEMMDSDDGDYAANKAQVDCLDFRVYKGDYGASNPADENTDRLPIQIKVCTHGASPKLVVWVAVEDLGGGTTDPGEDVKITLYYNATGKTQPNADAEFGSEDVWCEGDFGDCTQNYTAVYHMDEASGTVYDSTANGNDLDVIGGSPIYEAEGFTGIGYGIQFVAADSEYLKIVSEIVPGSASTFSAWFYLTDKDADYSIMSAGDDINGERIQLRFDTSSDEYRFGAHDGTAEDNAASEATPAATTWTYIIGVAIASDNRWIKVNNDDYKSSTGNRVVNDTDNFTIGVEHILVPRFYMNGIIDEARVSGVARSADWAAAEYLSQSAPETYLVEGSPSAP